MDGAPLSPLTRATGVIGPNSVIQLGETMTDFLGRDAARRLYDRAGCAALLNRPPTAMIDQSVPVALFGVLWRHWPEDAARVAREAGLRTADYIMQNRIPRIACGVVRVLPARTGAALLISAIARNAWTFAGSGQCETGTAQHRFIAIHDNPLSMPGCAWHQAVLERLFTRLVSSGIRVAHRSCCRDGAGACRFEILLPGEVAKVAV